MDIVSDNTTGSKRRGYRLRRRTGCNGRIPQPRSHRRLTSEEL